MTEINRFQNTSVAEVFGRIAGRYRIRRCFFEIYVIPALNFGLLVLALLIYAAAGHWLMLPVCVLPLAALFVGVLRHRLATRGDELRIYENGFVCRSGGRRHVCRWEEIAAFARRESNARERKTGVGEAFPLGSVLKRNGQIIVFDECLDGTPEIVRRFEAHRAKRRGARIVRFAPRDAFSRHDVREELAAPARARRGRGDARGECPANKTASAKSVEHY